MKTKKCYCCIYSDCCEFSDATPETMCSKDYSECYYYYSNKLLL